MVGKKVLRTDSEALALLGRGVDSGLVSARSPLDGVRRLSGFRRVAATRLVVTVSNSYDEQLASWRLQAIVHVQNVDRHLGPELARDHGLCHFHRLA